MFSVSFERTLEMSWAVHTTNLLLPTISIVRKVCIMKQLVVLYSVQHMPRTPGHRAPLGPFRAPPSTLCSLVPLAGVGVPFCVLLLTCRLFALFPRPARARPSVPFGSPPEVGLGLFTD